MQLLNRLWGKISGCLVAWWLGARNSGRAVDEADFLPFDAAVSFEASRLLVFAPHPDDEIFGCGGMLAAALRRGSEVRVVIATDGALGGDVPNLAQVRRQESEHAARLIGYPAPTFWNFEDRSLCDQRGLETRVFAEIEAYGPDLVLAPSWWEVHPDHVALSSAVTRVFAKKNTEWLLALYEVGVPLPPNRLVNITAFVALKQSAMAAFGSQLKVQDYGDQMLALNRFRSYTLGPSVTHAEAFRRVGPMEANEALNQGVPLTLRKISR